MKAMGDVIPIDEDSISDSLESVSASKEFGQRTLRSLKRGLGRIWRRHRGNVSITEYDPSYKVSYLGNVLTGWAKGEGCVEKPVSTLWRNYVSSNRPDVSMRLTITSGGLTATTKDHGLTEYWAHRVTYCTAPASHPRLFVWVYRHEGRRLRPELRCHAAICSKESTARRLAATLNARLHQALLEFRRDKVSKQNARLSLANAVYENPSLPRRKILLSTGGLNYKPPLERSKSAPKLSAIEEDSVAEEIEQKRLLEELRSLENVARSWQDHDSWKLSRFIDVLHRESDENGSISSGCETASTANSEERTSTEETHTSSVETNRRISKRRSYSEESHSRLHGPRRNSDGSPNFMTCTGSPHFRRKCTMRKSFSSRSDGDESMEEEEEMENNSNLFEYEDVEEEDFDVVVDYRPRGESSARTETLQENIRNEDVSVIGNNRLDGDKCINRLNRRIDDYDEPFLTLDSLDEEADSDESGYVEAPPKALIDQVDGKGSPTSATEKIDDENKLQATEIKLIHETEATRPESPDTNSRFRDREKDKVDFIKCPISETIKKLANASLRSSKSFDISTSNCLNKALNNLKPTKPSDGVRTIEVSEESPSLMQRKQLLAQHGVTV